MPEATYAVDGVPMDDRDGRWFLRRATRRPAVGNPRVSELEVPGRDGVIAVRQGIGSGAVQLSVTVMGDTFATLEANLLALQSVLMSAREVTWQAALGVSRSARVTRVTLAEPEWPSSLDRVWQEAVLSVQPFWHSGDPIIVERTLTNGTITFDELEGVTGKLADAIIRIKGPLSSLALTDPVSGTGLVTGSALTAAQYLYVDTATWDGWVSSSDSAWSGGGSARFVDFPAGGQLGLWPSMVPVEVARNLATNPSFESVSGPVVLFRNLARDPECTSLSWGTSGQTPNPPLVQTAEGLRLDITHTENIGFNLTDYAPPDNHPARLMVRARANRTIPCAMCAGGWLDPALMELGTEWRWIEAATPHAVSTGVTGLLFTSTSQHAPGDWVEISHVLYCDSTYTGPWFSGENSPDPDFTPAWAGAENASTSTLSVAPASGFNHFPGNGRKTFSSTRWSSSGDRSLRIWREGSAVQAAAGAVVTSAWYPQGTATILATCHIPEGYDPSEDVSSGQSVSRGIYLLQNLGVGFAQAPPTPGTYPLRLTVDLSAITNPSIRLGGGGAIGQSVYWDDLAIVEGDYDGPWFGGGFTPPGYETSVVDGVTILSKLDPARKAPQLVAAGTGFTSASRVAIRSRRWFL